MGKRQEKEDEVEDSYKNVVAKRNKSYTTHQYRLSARMYTSGLHDSLETPPNISAFSSNPPNVNERNLLLSH